MTDHLEPLEPSKGVQMYLDTRKQEVADSTYRSQKSRLKKFALWCDRNGIDNLNDLSGRTLHEYGIHLRNYYTQGDGDGPASMTVETRISTIRVFLRFCEDVDAVRADLAEKMALPDVTRSDRQRDEYLARDDAEHIIEQLRDYYPATREHTIFLLAWRTAIRIGAIRGLDCDDFDSDEKRLAVRHRPETDTPLKNKEEGERKIALTANTVEVLERYIEVHRPPTTDEYGRKPLFATREGRATKTTLRSWLYRAQLPCHHSNDCPHGEDPLDCAYNTDKERHHCPSTAKPHSIRRGGVTKFLNDDVPKGAVGDRVDMSKQVMDEHYDQRTEEQKTEQRRQYFSE